MRANALEVLTFKDICKQTSTSIDPSYIILQERQRKTNHLRRESRRKKQCQLCKRFVANRKRHMDSVHNEDKVSCDFCGKKLSRSDVLRTHVLNRRQDELGEAGKRCGAENCDKMFWSEGTLKWHMQFFHAKSRFQCGYCGDKSPNEGTVRKHTRDFHPEKLY